MALDVPATLNLVDTATSSYISDIFAGLSSAVQTPATAMMSLSIMIMGMFIWLGYSKMTLGDAGKLLFKIFFVWALITQWPLYNYFFVDLFTNTPDQVAGAMLSNSPLTSGSGPSPSDKSGVTVYIDNVWKKYDQVAEKAAASRGWLSSFLAFLVVSIAQILLLGFGIILIVLSKIALAVLLGIAPLFIIAVLFRGTGKLFESWLQSLFNYMFLPILVFAAILVPLYIADAILTKQITFHEITDADIFKLLFFSILGFVVLLQTPTIASALAGGVALSTLNAVAIAYRSGKSANSWERNFWQHRNKNFETRGQRLRGAAGRGAARTYDAAKNLRSNRIKRVN